MLNGKVINPMSNKRQNTLYEQLIYDISCQVKYQINEAYDNALLEQYGAKDLFNEILKDAKSDTKKLFKLIRKFLVFIIEHLHKTNKYKKAQEIIYQYKKRVQKYLVSHKEITPRVMLKIIVTVLAIYGGVSLVKDCKQTIQSLQHSFDEQVLASNDSVIINSDTIVTFEEVMINELVKDTKNIKTSEVNSSLNILPSDAFEQDNNYEFRSSKECQDFIKKHEMCLLYPYYANDKEESEGKVTIGYGHVVIKSDGELYNQIQKLKKQGKIKQSYTRNGKTKKIILNPNHCQEIISAKQADELFLKDIKIAEERAYKAITTMKTDKNVKYYMLYNQKIKDGIISLCYNAGNLKQEKYSFITNGLENCRFDTKTGCINAGDYNVSFKKYKNIKDNNSRRTEEYNQFFLGANVPVYYYK